MWEDAAPKAEGLPAVQPPAAADRPAHGSRAAAGESYVLWAQLLLCGLILAAVLAARALAPAVFRELRVAYTAARNETGLFLSEERQFSKFTQETLAALESAAKAVWAQLDPAGPDAPEEAAPTAPAAQTAHAKPQKKVPGGCRDESYLPAFELTYPLPAATWATSGYGWRTDPVAGQGDDFHTGLDLHADEGTPVLAAADGVVRRAGRGASYGNYLRILHENGDETLYAHMQYLFVRAGQSVKAGEVLGTVGHTGNVTGPHLHFELLHQGWRFDPTEALQDAGLSS